VSDEGEIGMGAHQALQCRDAREGGRDQHRVDSLVAGDCVARNSVRAAD